MDSHLKKIIYSELDDTLNNVEIIFYGNSIWFINREQEYWYLKLEDEFLWWRYDFFTSFFTLFSLNSNEFSLVIYEWFLNKVSQRIPESLKFNLEGKIKKHSTNSYFKKNNRINSFSLDTDYLWNVNKVLNDTNNSKINL